MTRKLKKPVKIGVLTLVSLVIISLGLVFFAQLSLLSSLRIVFGSVYVLFIPGFLISYIFFPKTKEFEEEQSKEKIKYKEESSIDWLERIALSFALSIAIVPLAVFYLNLIGLKINTLNSFLTILGILIISGIILSYKNYRR